MPPQSRIDPPNSVEVLFRSAPHRTAEGDDRSIHLLTSSSSEHGSRPQDESLLTDSEAAAEGAPTEGKETAGTATKSTDAEAKPQPSPLASAQPVVSLEDFWRYDEPLDSSLVVITPAEQTVLEVIGDMPLATSEAQAITAHLQTLYQSVAQQAMMTALS